MLELQSVNVAFDARQVLSECSLTLGPGERLALMGPSGCGKTTLLRVALGLQKPESGSVRSGFQRVGAVFQEARLFPWLTAAENIALMLPGRKDANAEARRWLAALELGDAADRYPAALSGGMQQRVSLARALAVQPELLVLDEPLKELDEALRQRVCAQIVSACPDSAILMATHSADEAEALGCRILRYREGRFTDAAPN